VKAVLQRVRGASARVDGEVMGAIERGILVLLGVFRGDGESNARQLADRVVGYRIFPDEAGKMNRALLEAGGELLVVSQFTLCADGERGRRPSFDAAAPPDEAERLYETFVEACKRLGAKVATGVFGAMMQVELINDGPVTFILER